MNSLDGDRDLLPLAGHPRQPRGAPKAWPTSITACKAAGYDLVDRRDARHRPG